MRGAAMCNEAVSLLIEAVLQHVGADLITESLPLLEWGIHSMAPILPLARSRVSHAITPEWVNRCG